VTFLDANYFLRYLTQPATPGDRVMGEIARGLFEAVQRGDEEVTTTEVVLHEVAYVLASKRHYHVPPADIAAALKLILRLPGFRLPRGDKRRYLRALDLYASHPTLGFADAIVAATVEQQGVPLATFDRHFDRLPGITRWQPPAGSRAQDESP
jgi:predicted nucleic acid-binding protein